MKKTLSIILSVMMILALLAGCGCQHEWGAADCKAPKTCSLCGETEGEIGDHSWNPASCDAPKTCKVCAKTGGDVLEHKWEDATTEAPKTCSACGKTEGDKINVDERFKTENCKSLFGTWKTSYLIDGETALDMTIPGEDLDYTVFITFIFTNDGKMTFLMEFDEESFLHVTYLIAVEEAYAALEESGFSREEADSIMIDQTGMTVPEAVEQELANVKIEDYNEEIDAVYYVYGGQVHAASDWDQEFDGQNYTMSEDGKLTIMVPDLEEELEFTKEP